MNWPNHHPHHHHHQQRHQLPHNHHPPRGSEEASKHVSLLQSLPFIFLHNFKGLSKKRRAARVCRMINCLAYSFCHILYLLNHSVGPLVRWCVNPLVSCSVCLFTRQAGQNNLEKVFFLIEHFFSLSFHSLFLFPPFHSSYSSCNLHRRRIFPILSPRLQPHHLLNIQRRG